MTRRSFCAAVVWALFVLAGPVPVDAPGVQVERPEPALRFDLMGLPDPAVMARLIMVESNGNPQAVNPKTGARGLCQIMPSLARSLGWDPDRLYDAAYAMDKGARWLGILERKYGPEGALRAYLCGETNRGAWYSGEADAYVRNIMKEE